MIYFIIGFLALMGVWAVFMCKALWDLSNIKVDWDVEPEKKNCLGMTNTETALIGAAVLTTTIL